MPEPLRLMAILAHPDDECLGVGGTLAHYSAEGVESYLVTATRGQSGRYRGIRRGEPGHPGREALGRLRERELRAAAEVLGVRELVLLDYVDGELDQAEPREALSLVVRHVRRLRPHVVLTFAPDGAYGHPDHIAISQLASAASVAAADPSFDVAGGSAAPHAVSKLYYLTWPTAAWDAYQAAFRKLVSVVDGVERQAVPWPDWEITTVIDTQAQWDTVWRAIECHESQMSGYENLRHLSARHHEQLWSRQWFYRAFSTVNGGRTRESDLFDGLRG